jgi:hypothetical protein
MRSRLGRLMVWAAWGTAALVLLTPVDAGARAPGQNGSLGRLSAADIDRLSAQANQRSIIVFKNQHPELPPRAEVANQRAQAVDSDQAGVKSELAQLHSKNVNTFHVVNAVSATISKAEADRLSANPAVQAVVPDIQRKSVRAADQATGGSASTAGSEPAATGSQPICPSNPKVPLLEPEALQVMNVENQPGSEKPAAHDLVDGTGVKVAIIGDGLDPANPDLQRNGKSLVYDFQDFSGFGNNAPTDGREAFLDAGAIASQGTQVYDLANFVNAAHPLPPNCNIRIKGVAPGASIAVMNVSGSNAGFFDSTIVQAIDWAVNVDRVNILNESFGGNTFPDKANDPVAIANNNAVAAGITVVASSGDSGPTNTIGSPASDPGILTVGGTTTFRVYRQATRYGVQLSAGGWESNNITALSSAGTTQFGPRTVDVVAPGDRGWELCSTDIAHFFGCKDFDNNNIGQPIWAAGGTSLSAPLTSGTAALVIQAYAKTHGGAAPSPDLIKRIIVSSAQDLGAPADHQGAGLVNALKAVQLAESIQDEHGTPSPKGSSLLASKTSLVSTAAVGTERTFHLDVTNTGANPQHLDPSVVGLNPSRFSNDQGSVTLNASSPSFIDDRGRIAFYQSHQFSVPEGADYLNGDIIWQAQQQRGSIVFETVFDPAGRVAAYSLLGEASGHGHIEVRHPSPGTWKSVIWTVKTAGPYAGVVKFSYFTQRFQSAGSVSPSSTTLAPGQTVGLNVAVETPESPGDVAASLRLNSANSGEDNSDNSGDSNGDNGGDNRGAGSGVNNAASNGAIPIVLRSLVAVGSAGGSFRGTLTGGVTLGQQFTYQFDVPAGKPILDLGLHFQDPNYPIVGFLVDPNGQPLDTQSTAILDSQGSLAGFGTTMQFFEKTPAAGRWAVVVALTQFISAIDGAHFREPFTGRIRFRSFDADTTGLPNSVSTVLPQGKPVTATIAFANSGNSPKDFFVDGRLDQRVQQPLLGYGATGVGLPLSLQAQPFFFVPPSSDRLTVGAQATVPITMEISPSFGGPDILGTPLPQNSNLAEATAPELAPGPWFALPEPKGPFPPNGLGPATADVAATAETNAFDPAVAATSGNAWIQVSVDNSAPYTPMTLNPGQSGTITVTITPGAAKGTVVHGFLEIETLNLFTLAGDEVVVVPYTYKVG